MSMKILNVSEGTVYLDDINVAVLYSRNREPQEVEDKVAKKSPNLKSAIKMGLLMDVTNGIPEKLPALMTASSLEDRPEGAESPFIRRQSMLVKDDHFGHVQGGKAGDTEPPRESKAKSGPSSKDAFLADGKMSVAWSGPSNDAGGYARLNRKFMFGLEDKGVKVAYDFLPSIPDMDPQTMERLRKLMTTKIPKDAPKIYGMTAPLHYNWDRYKMLFTMMETRRLHKDYVERCNCADEIVVPSHWCKQVFQESGVRKPLHVIPLGVDTSIYRPDAEPIGFSKNLKPFVFLSVFGWSLRKGYDVLLRAYFEEFTSDEPVTLLLSTRYFGSSDESKKRVIRDEIAKIRSMTRNPKQPHLAFFGDVLSDEMMPQIFAASDCYVLISRGEGFGLPYLESGACDIPVISSRYSGQTDFLDDDNSYLVDVDGFESAERNLAWISYFYENAEFPIFGAKAVEQTRHLMRYVYEHQDEAAVKSRRLHEKVVKEYDWQSCIDKMYGKLESTYREICK
jgi:glycosyltransferase involved in cell wall biosynthesis